MPPFRQTVLRPRSSLLAWIAAPVAGAAILVACDPGSDVPAATATPTAAETTTPVSRAPEVATAVPVPLTPPAGVEAAFVAHLAGRLQVAPSSITVVSFEAALWPNGCLGLGGDRVCSQALVPGWLAILRAPDGTEYRYRGAGTRFEAEP
jgi:hypothetical protein